MNRERQRDTRMMALVHETDKKDFKEALEKKGLDIPTYLRYRIHLFCEQIEAKIRKGEVEEVPTRREQRNSEEEWVEIPLRLDRRLKERLDQGLKYVPESRNELIRMWIRELIVDNEKTRL